MAGKVAVDPAASAASAGKAAEVEVETVAVAVNVDSACKEAEAVVGNTGRISVADRGRRHMARCVVRARFMSRAGGAGPQSGNGFSQRRAPAGHAITSHETG